jgi:hypothetical protein
MINYWADVGSNGGAQAHELYLRDALYAVGNNRLEGEQKIRAFYPSLLTSQSIHIPPQKPRLWPPASSIHC